MLLKSFRHYFFDKMRWLYYLLFNERHKMNMRRYYKSDNKKPYLAIMREKRELRKYWGCVPMQYYTHDFYLRDCPLTIDQMKDFIPGYFFYKVLYPKYDNIKKAASILSDKIVMSSVFKGLSIPSSNVAFYIIEGRVLKDGIVINIESEFYSMLDGLGVEKVFIKPADGEGGKGILIARKDAAGCFCCDGVKLNIKFLTKLTGDYLVEPCIKQIDYLNTIYSNSVNTLRVITKRSGDGVSIVAITLRMGNSGREIDNGSAGGFLIGIDPATGKSIHPYASYEYGAERIYTHPDSGFKFSELQIPNWDRYINQIESVSNNMFFINLIGWDVALTKEGILCIEANTLFGIDHTQSGVGGIKDLLMDEEPDRYYI